MKKISAIPQTIQEYTSYEPYRLGDEMLNEGQLFHLMMKSEGRGPEAYLAPVYLADIRRELGRVSFGVLYTDDDLQPAPKSHNSQLVDKFWLPRPPLPLCSTAVDAIAKTGYFMPYSDEIEMEFLLMANNILLDTP